MNWARCGTMQAGATLPTTDLDAANIGERVQVPVRTHRRPELPQALFAGWLVLLGFA
eukprot:COSAG06_NODE_59402_length_274_cov_0.594286_1_plen_56_part_01